MDLDSVYAICQRTGCALQRTKRFVVPSVGGATRFANLQQKLSKTQKKIGRRVVPNTLMVTIEIVINSTRVYQHMCMTISCRYCIAFEVMLLFLVFNCFCTLHTYRRVIRRDDDGDDNALLWNLREPDREVGPENIESGRGQGYE